MALLEDGALARRMLLAAQNTRRNPMAPYSGLTNYGHCHINHKRDVAQESGSGVHDGANGYSRQLVASILHFRTSLLGRIPPPPMRRGNARGRCGHFWRLFVPCWLILTITMVIRWIPLQTTPHELFSGDAPTASPGPSGRSRTADRLAEYMVRFNVPQQNIDLVWLKTGGTTIRRGNHTYHFAERKNNVGVYAGYVPMYDSSAQRYCEGTTAKIDTQRTLGKSLMASGACPNWGKVIAFTDSSGGKLDTQRWQNEIHDNVMPHTTKGCKLHAAPGNSEIPKDKEGMAMYSGFMTACPYNEAVYEKDMVPDGEYDPTICNFVTPQNKLWFLDTRAPSKGKPYTPYAFHGNGGYLGYDYEGDTKHTGCPPYSPPRTTSPMKDASWLTNLFACVDLSRCTNHCWPFADGQPCFRSLPAMFDLKTNECRLLGHHTQFFQQSSCAGSPTHATDKYYCIKPVKTTHTSRFVYVTSHTRPDYETQCPPKEPLLDVQWGMLIRSKYCQPLQEVKSVENVTAERCGQTVFENSSSDDPNLPLPGLHWGTFTSKECADMNTACRTTAKGRCALYNRAPECFLHKGGSISYTSLTAVDPSLAKRPEEVAVLPLDPCATVDCGTHGTCSEGKCQCDKGWGGERCDERLPCWDVVCQNQGYCDNRTGKCVCGQCYEGSACEVKKPKCCVTEQDCGDREKCDTVSGQCVCKPGYTGANCEPAGTLCPDDACNGAGHCDPHTGMCTCYPCFYGETCSIHIEDCCESDEDCNFPRGTCNLSRFLCECEDGFEGPDCAQLDEDLCEEWCVQPDHLKENASECHGIDCLYYCCKAILECHSVEEQLKCYSSRMDMFGAGCCLGKSETSNMVAYAAAGGIAALLLVVALGALAVYRRKKTGQLSSAVPSVEFEKGTGGRVDEPSNEEAIDVCLEDFKSHSEDRSGVSKGVISTTWES